jgi:single-stranded DNA-binding protein
MSKINQLALEGNLVSDFKKSGTKERPILLGSIAHNDDYKDKSGEWVQNPNFFSIMVSGSTKYLEMVNDRFKKGNLVFVSGKLTSYKDNEGTTRISLKIDNISGPFERPTFEKDEKSEKESW